jgi:hypothetical protein
MGKRVRYRQASFTGVDGGSGAGLEDTGSEAEAGDTDFGAEVDARSQERPAREAYERGPRERHVHEMHVHEMHAHKMHARKKAHEREIFMRCTPLRCMPCEIQACEIYAYERHTPMIARERIGAGKNNCAAGCQKRRYGSTQAYL